MAATGTSLAALKVGPSTTELREFALPDIPPDAALLKVEIAGVCGTDVSQYKLPLRGAPLIMGHENVGYLTKVGREFERLKGFKEGDLVFLEHYLPCGHCEWDHMGEYRHCAATEWFYDPTAIRYGYTAIDIKPSLWGGFSHYVYLPLNAVLHRVPKGLTPEEAGIATPMSNGVQWTLFDGGVGYGSSVLIQGPGQQGMCCAMAASQAGASLVIVTGTSRDARRLEVAQSMGATHVIDVQNDDPFERVMEITEQRGVDVVVDCVGGEGWNKSLAALAKGGRVVTCGATAGANPPTDLRRVFWNNLSIFGSTLGSREDFRQVVNFLCHTNLRPIIDQVFPLKDAAAAHERMERGEQFGKIVLHIAD
jgi:threonine dehydrogenase-like Zn-dependent dehydrogenase